MNSLQPLRKTLAVLTIFLLSMGLGSASLTGLAWEQKRPEILRLHIPAASDSSVDQSIKLQVRNAVLEHHGALFQEAHSEDHAEALAAEHLSEIQSTVEAVLKQNNAPYGCTLELKEVFFPARRYSDSIVLPAGNYRALRIVLGDGSGKNWWCVLYPPLCVSAACADLSSTELPELLLQEDGTPQIKPAFAVVEFTEKLKNHLKECGLEPTEKEFQLFFNFFKFEY